MENLAINQRTIIKPVFTRKIRTKATGPEFISDIYMKEMSHSNLEAYKVLVLDSNNGIIEAIDVSKRNCDDTTPTARDIIDEAFKYNAKTVIILQNRVFGDPLPNKKDREFTKSLVAATRLVGIKTLDHIIFGNKRYFSFDEKYLI